MKSIKTNANQGITLIALVITIIILLILAGISIATLTGENGILARANTAKEESLKAKYEEALKIIANELRADKITNNWSSKEYLDKFEEKINEDETFNGSEINRKNDETIIIITKEGYGYRIKENKIEYIGKQGEIDVPTLEESMIKFSYSPNLEENQYTNGPINVTIKSEDTDYTIEYSKNGNNWSLYEFPVSIEENGPIYARLVNELHQVVCSSVENIKNIDKIDPLATITLNRDDTGSTVSAVVEQKDDVSGIDIEKCKWVYNTNSEDIGTDEENYKESFTATNETISLIPKGAGTYYLHVLTVDKAGNKKETKSEEVIVTFDSNVESIIQGVENIDSDGIYTMIVNDVTYNVHMYCYDQDQIWTGTKTFGDSSDVGTATSNATRMVIVKVNGNLTIDSGAVVQPYFNNYGGPKGFFLYCTGTLTNKGTIANNHGAKAPGENVYLWKSASGIYQTVDAVGGAGASSVTASGYYRGLAGLNGGAGTGRKTGGGASGASSTYNEMRGASGSGTAGTSYSGGTGGAGSFRKLLSSYRIRITSKSKWSVQEVMLKKEMGIAIILLEAQEVEQEIQEVLVGQLEEHLIMVKMEQVDY